MKQAGDRAQQHERQSPGGRRRAQAEAARQRNGRPARWPKMVTWSALALVLMTLVAGVTLAPRSVAQRSPEDHAGHAGEGQRVTRTVVGPLYATSPDAAVRLEVSLDLEEGDPRANGSLPPGIPVGEPVLLTFQLSNPESGQPLTGLAPSAYLKAAGAQPQAQDAHLEASDPFEVRELFVLAGPVGDLGVIEAGGHTAHQPGHQLGQAVGSSLVGMVILPGPSTDAALDRANRYIFATLPTLGQVAVIDTTTRRRIHALPVGTHPFHVAVEPSGQRIWVTNDGDGTVTIIDAATHDTRSASVGTGHHDIAFSSDSRLVFVSNSQSGTVSVIDTEGGHKVMDVPVGVGPHGLDYSATTGRLYVANEGSGTISVLAVDGERVAPIAAIQAGEGTTQVQIDPSGQVGVASNRRANTLTLFSALSHEVLKTVQAGGGPDDIVFLGDYAMVRNSLTPDVTFVNVTKPDIAGEMAVGSEPVLDKPLPGVHARLFVNATGDEVLVPNPAEGWLYHIHIMMGQPMVMSQTKVNLGTDFVLSLVNQVLEVGPGMYQRVVRFDREGTYTLDIGSGGDRQPVTFTLDVVAPKIEKPWAIEPLVHAQPYVAGRDVVLQVRVVDRQTGAAVEGLQDGIITVYSATPGQGIWQRLLRAEHAGDGIYQATVQFPQAGSFALFFTSQAHGLRSEDNPHTTLEVVSR